MWSWILRLARRTAIVLTGVLVAQLLFTAPVLTPVAAAPAAGSPAPAPGAWNAARTAALANLRPAGPGELVELRRANSRTFRTDTGYRVELSARPLYYEVQPGVFDDIDTSLVPVSDGSPFRFQTRANAWTARFTDDPGRNEVRVKVGGRWFSFELDEDTGAGRPGYRAAAAGSRLSYAAQGAPVSIDYELGAHALKESIVLHGPTAKSTWTFRLRTEALVATQHPDGRIGLAYDNSITEEVALLQPVFALDAAGARIDGSMGLRQQAPGDYEVTVSVDPAWLADSARRFPVIIDPSVEMAYGAGMSSVITNGYTSPWSGNSLEMRGDGNIRTLLKFDLGALGVPKGVVPANQLVSAQIQARIDTSRTTCTGYTQQSDCYAQWTVQPLAQDWYYQTVTWSRPRWNTTSWSGGDPCDAVKCPNLPAGALSYSTDIFTLPSPSNPPPSIQIDVTAAAQRMLDGAQPNFGFLLTLTNNHPSQNDVFLWLNDASGNPYYSPLLNLNFVADTTLPAVSITSPADGSTPQGNMSVTVTASDTVNGGSSGNLSRVELLLDNNVVGATQTDAPGSFNFSVDLTRYVAGHHRLQARAYDWAGNHAESAVVGISSLGGLMAPPSNLVVTPQSGSSFALQWAPAVAMRPAAATPPSSVTYTVERSASSSFTSPVTVASALTATTYTDSPGAGTWYYRVKAVSATDSGSSAYSNVATSQAPVAPYAPVAASAPNANINLSWQPSPSAYADSGVRYKIYRAVNGGAPSLVAGDLSGTGWTDTTTAGGNSYSYAVSAVNQAGQESGQAAAVAITAATSSGPAAPGGVQAVSGRDNAITVAWNADNDTAITYSLLRSTDRSAWTQIATGLSGWFYTDTGLTDGTTYYYAVQAVAGGNAGPQSLPAGAQSASGRRLGVDSRWPTIPAGAADGTAYLNLQNGNLALAATDSVVAAPYLPVVVRRTYNSQGVPSGSSGDNWRLNADWTVQDFGSYAVLTTGDGGEHVYTLDGVNYRGDTLWYWTLSKDESNNFLLTRPDRMQYHFNSAGQLASIVERNGNTITYNYSGDRLASITDPVGRTTALGYDLQGRLTSGTDGAGRVIQYGYDTAGRLASVTDAEGWTSTYQYDAAGRLVYAADPSGRYTAFTYDDTGRVTSVTDPLGNRSTLAYSTSGSGGGTTDVTDPLGARTTFGYDSHGFLTSLTDAYQNTQPTPRSWSYSYTYMAGDATKLQTLAITNLRGLQTQLTYDSTGNVTQATDQGTDLTAPGVTIRSSSLSYLSGSSDVTSVTDPESNTTTDTWSAAAPFRLLSVADALGNTVQYSYSGNPAQPGWITGITDARGNQTQFSYDSLGNVTSTTNAVYLGSTLKTLAVSMTYYGDGSVQDVSEMHDVNSSSYPVTHTDYDKLGRRIRVEYPDGSAEAVIYDPAGQVAVATTRGGQQGRYSYDGAGRLSSVTDNAGNTTSYSYDAAGNATSITDALGHATTLQYDALHRLTRRQDASGMVTLTAYDEMGNAVSTTRGDQSIVAGNGYTVTASYYLTGLLRSSSEPLRSDSVLPNSGSPPAAGTTVYNVQSLQYNRVGKATQSTDGGNMATTYTYDSAYRLLQVHDARGGMTEYAYDAGGSRTDVWDAEHTRAEGASSTHFAFDALGRQVSVTDPLGNVVSQVYDEAGNVAQRTEPRTSGTLTTTYGYDLGHRLATVSYPNLTGRGPVTQTQYVYDGGGRRLFSRDDYGVARYAFDTLGRLTQAISRQENDSFNYDAVGNRTGVTYSIGTVSYAYDAANRMTGVTDPLGNTTTYSYDNYGHISQVALPGGIKRSVSFWALPGGGPTTDRIQSLSNTNSSGSTTFWAGTYQYDYVGNVRNINATWAQHPTPYDITASYDNLYRLTQWTDNSVTDATTKTSYFSYDAAGNRLRWGNLNDTGTNNFKTPVGNTVSQNATFDAANRTVAQNTAMRNNWTQLNPASPGQSTTYEGNGNTSVERYIYPGSTSNFDAYLGYDYDDANRLTRYSGELHDTTNGWLDQEYYSYDGDGRRLSWDGHLCVPYPGVQCTGSNVVNNYKEYEYVGSEQVAERHENGATPVWYVLGQGGEKLYALHLKTDTWALTADVYVKDHLGSIREVVEPNGNVANWYDYDAFGLPKAQTTTLANSYQFASAPLDVLYRNSTTGYASFYNLKARLYSPLVGRFLTQDTYRGNPWQPWTQNLYAYVGNNPVNYVDPTGHFGESISWPSWTQVITSAAQGLSNWGHVITTAAAAAGAFVTQLIPPAVGLGILLHPAPIGTMDCEMAGGPQCGVVSSTLVEGALPQDAQDILGKIRSGGSFPYPQDGTTFKNREGLLPAQEEGYYKEYTVPTDGERGVRRIVVGQGGETYYTDDHYKSFTRVVPDSNQGGD